MTGLVALRADGLTKHFGAAKNPIRALSNVSFDVATGSSFGIVGESGCGKSTLARILASVTEPTAGTVYVGGVPAAQRRATEGRRAYRRVQLVFQDPPSAFSPRMEIGTFLEQGLRHFGMADRPTRRRILEAALDQVALPRTMWHRLPHELSGGELQRVVIARALSVSPEVLILDEATSALDVSTQSQIVTLIQEIQDQSTLALVVISHDIGLVERMCDRIAVMRHGRIVETLPADTLNHASHPYTKELVDHRLRIDGSA